MSLTTCKLTGANLTKPVIDRLNGYVYQKDEIEKHIIKTGQCPVTGREMQLEDLVEIKQNEDLSLKASVHTGENVPAILKKINNEWENIMIYNFHLKKELEDLKKESSHLLYQHEAANLVICRLLKEKEEYLTKLNYFKSQVKELNYNTKKEYDEESEFDYMGITEDLTAKIMETGMALAKARKNRKLPADFCEKDQVAKFKATANYVNEALKGAAKAAYTCFDLHPLNNSLFLSANLNAEISLNYFNKEDEKISESLFVEKVNSKKINLVKFKKDESLITFISASADNTASVFTQNQGNFAHLNLEENLNSKNLKGLKIEEAYRVTNHTSSVIGADFHTLSDYCLVGSRDGNWSFHNYRKGICLTKQSSESKKEVNCLEMHPDGSIFACGEAGGIIRLWDICQQTNLSSIEAHDKFVDTISFSNNGFYFASGSNIENSIKIWDLRKLSLVNEIKLENKFDLKKIKFDPTGTYIGFSGIKLGVINTKTAEIIVEFDDHKDVVNDFAFASNCGFIASASIDKTIKVFSL